MLNYVPFGTGPVASRETHQIGLDSISNFSHSFDAAKVRIPIWGETFLCLLLPRNQKIMKIMKILLVLIGASLGIIATGTAATYTWQDAFQVGLFVKTNATVGNSESQGTIIVDGGLTTGQSPYQVALRDGAQTIDGIAMAVGGQVVIGAQSAPGIRVSGSVNYGSTNKIPDPDSNGNYWIDNTLSAPGGTTGFRDRLAGSDLVNLDQAFFDLTTMSETIAIAAGLEGTQVTFDNNSFTLPRTGIAPVSIPEAFSQPVYLYHVLASEINGIVFNLTSFGAFQPNDLIVIDVINNVGPGLLRFGVDFGTVSGGGVNPWADNILWNVNAADLTVRIATDLDMISAETKGIVTNNKPFVGSLLAPNSTFQHDLSQSVEGSIIVNAYNGADAGGLFPSTSGAVSIADSLVPEPTSAVAGALLVFGLLRRQRR